MPEKFGYKKCNLYENIHCVFFSWNQDTLIYEHIISNGILVAVVEVLPQPQYTSGIFTFTQDKVVEYVEWLQSCITNLPVHILYL